MAEIITRSISGRSKLEAYGAQCLTRCRDCRNYHEDSLGTYCSELFDEAGEGPRPVGPNDYCSWADPR